MSGPNTIGKGAATKIRDHVISTLAGVSVGAGYTIDLNPETPRLEGLPRAHGRCTVKTQGVEWRNSEEAAHGCDRGVYMFDVWVTLVIPESTDTDPDELMEGAADDVRMALLADSQRGGECDYTEITGWRPRDDGEYGCIVSGMCVFTTPYRSPRE